MADETENNPNDPNSSNTSAIDASQTDLAKELNSVLEQVANRLEKINEITKSQADMMINMAQTFQGVQSSVSNMSQSAEIITESIAQAAETVITNIDSQSMQNVSQSLEEVSETASKGLTANSKSLTGLKESVTSAAASCQSVSESLSGVSDDISGNMSQISDDILTFRENTKGLKVESRSFVEAIKELDEKISNLVGGIASTFKNIFMGAFGMIKTVVSSIGSLVGAATQFVKFSLTIPFTIVQEAAKLGNQIRTDLVEVIQQSAEDLKESFDFESSIGQGIQEMTARGKGMLLEFQNPSSELVKLFDMGASGIANMIKEVGTNVAAMGHFSEIFGRSIMGDEKRLKNFTKMVRGFGFSSEDIQYMALDASVNLEHINVRMAKLGVTLESTAKEFGVDRKRLSKNFMIMRKNITQFGHLSDEEIASTTARLTQMRIKLEDAVAVFDKFKTFEDAANSVAILSQTFGMNLDAFDMIQAKNPEDIINMFRNSMLETGRAFEDLNRFEKDLMAQHTGMSAESLAALMNYRDLGLTHQEAVDKMASERPEAKQMASLKKLNSAIKEVQKVMTFDSPFKAFASGVADSTTLTGELKDVMVSLSQGYEGIYNYAKKLDPKTWSGLVKPINSIINIMLGIFKSKAFKGGLTKTVEVMSHFIGQLFNFDEPTKALQNSAVAASNAGKELSDGMKSIGAANEKNVGVLVNLSGRIMGGIIKGAAIGFTALLMTANDGIDTLKTKMDARNPYKNIIETFFGWNPGDVTKMGDSLKNAVTDFFSKSDGMISLTGWLMEGFGDIFEVVIGIFGGALAAGIDKIFGTQFGAKPSVALAQTSLKSQRKPASETMQEISETLGKEGTVNRKNLASMIHDLNDRASTVTDKGQKAQLQTVIESLKTRFTEEGNSEDDFRNIALQTAAVMQGISQGAYKGRDLSTIQQINAQDDFANADDHAVHGNIATAGLAGAGGVLLASKMAAMLPFLSAIPGVNVVAAGALGLAGAGMMAYGLYDWFTSKETKSVTTAREFDKYMENKITSKLMGSLVQGSDFAPYFNNIYFKSFWANYGEEITAAAKKSKDSGYMNSISPEFEVGNFAGSPYYQKIFKNTLKGGLTTYEEQSNTILEQKPSGPSEEMVKDGQSVGDLEFLNKYINVSQSKNILNNLLASVSLPSLFEEETSATTIAASNYSGAKEIKINRSNRLTKQKVEDQNQKLTQLKKKLEEENIEVTADFVFTNEIIDKLMKSMAKSNLVRILGMPEYTNGVMSLTESALGSRCFNIGSDGTAATIETVQPSGS
jgi:RNAse (barnase) inhibitor barstar/uncharacterized membrane-anchored protein YhcB (DUF1043 family)